MRIGTCACVMQFLAQGMSSKFSEPRTLAGVYFLPVVHWTAVLSLAGWATAGMLVIRRAHAAAASMAQRVSKAAIVYYGGCLLSRSIFRAYAVWVHK
jgi:hypothetical protein